MPDKVTNVSNAPFDNPNYNLNKMSDPIDKDPIIDADPTPVIVDGDTNINNDTEGD